MIWFGETPFKSIALLTACALLSPKSPTFSIARPNISNPTATLPIEAGVHIKEIYDEFGEIHMNLSKEASKNTASISALDFIETNNIDFGVELISDKKKDQTYFLHAVKSKNFENTLFPLEDLTKNEVRSIAKENGLFNHKKKDSTGICFIGERPFREFLKNYFPVNPGPIVDLEKNVMGTHEGLVFHTIGQRHGLKIGD